MSFWDSVKKFAQPYADDDYDDYDEDDEYYDDYDEPAEAPRRASGRRTPPVSAPVDDEDDLDDGFGFSAAPSVPASSAASSFRGLGGVMHTNFSA